MITTDIDIKKLKRVSGKNKFRELKENNFIVPAKEAIELLDRCSNYWDALGEMRKQRKIARDYVFGDQMKRTIIDHDTGVSMTEEAYIKSQGRVPVNQNMVSTIVRNIVGQYSMNSQDILVTPRKSGKETEALMMTAAIESVNESNANMLLNMENLKEFLISGLSFGMATYGFDMKQQRNDIILNNVDINTLFFNSGIKDPRLRDIHTIGCFFDTTLEDIVGVFASNRFEEEKIREYYRGYSDIDAIPPTNLTTDVANNINFRTPEIGFCRYYMVWYLKGEWCFRYHDYADASYGITTMSEKELEEVNRERLLQAETAGISMEDVALIDYKKDFQQKWYYKCLTPDGYVLKEGESPYEHCETPFYGIVYPLIDGKAKGIVSDIIPMQEMANRIFGLIDLCIGSSAKGALLIDTKSISDRMSLKTMAKAWSRPDSVIAYDSKNGTAREPKQVNSNTVPIGAFDVFQQQLQMLNNVSGVNSAMQGQTPNSGTPASLYAQETENSSLNIKELFKWFEHYDIQKGYKVMKLIQQFWTDDRYLNVAGKDYSEDVKNFRHDKVNNIDFNYNITHSTNTPTFRYGMDTALMDLFSKQAIDIEMLLENSSFPFSKKLLESIKNRKEEILKTQNQIPNMEVQEELPLEQRNQIALQEVMNLPKNERDELATKNANPLLHEYVFGKSA